MEIAGGADHVRAPFHAAPGERRISRTGSQSRRTEMQNRIRPSDEIRHDRLAYAGNTAASRIPIERTADVVGKGRRSGTGQADEVGVCAIGKLRRDAKSAVIFIQIKIQAVAKAKIAEGIVVLELTAQGIRSPNCQTPQVSL